MRWELRNNRPHPFDEVKCKTCDGTGKIAVMQPSMFTTPTTTAKCPKCDNGIKLVSHFDSCPDAAMFRRPKEGE